MRVGALTEILVPVLYQKEGQGGGHRAEFSWASALGHHGDHVTQYNDIHRELWGHNAGRGHVAGARHHQSPTSEIRHSGHPCGCPDRDCSHHRTGTSD